MRAAVGVVLMASAVACGGRDEAASGDTARVSDTLSAPVVPRDTGAPAPVPRESQGDSGATKAPPGGGTRTPPPGEGRPNPGAATSDTLRGAVLEVGAAPATQIAIRPAGGGQIFVTGSQADALRRVTGAEVWASGTRAGSRMEVTRFVVRAVDGVAAIDGRLVADAAGGIAIVDGNGKRHALTNPPEALRAQVGARVWISGRPDAVNAFGVIAPA